MTAKFNPETAYLIVENLFDPRENRILAEIKVVDIDNLSVSESIELANHVNLDSYLGKGVSVLIGSFIDPVSGDEKENYFDVIVQVRDVLYGFQELEHLGTYPLIEGEFNPGIYKRENDFYFYKLENLGDFSNEYSDPEKCLADYDKYKLVCTADRVETVYVNKGREKLLETNIRHPFTYFDLYCPICSRLIIDFGCFLDYTSRYRAREAGCQHYAGQLLLYKDKYIEFYLERLESEYKLEASELFLMTDQGWQKPVCHIPPFDPVNSYWGKSNGDEEYTDVFLFLTAGKLIPKRRLKLISQ